MILSTIGLGIGAYALGAGAISSAAMIARGGVRAVGQRLPWRCSRCHHGVAGRSGRAGSRGRSSTCGPGL